MEDFWGTSIGDNMYATVAENAAWVWKVMIIIPCMYLLHFSILVVVVVVILYTKITLHICTKCTYSHTHTQSNTYKTLYTHTHI